MCFFYFPIFVSIKNSNEWKTSIYKLPFVGTLEKFIQRE